MRIIGLTGGIACGKSTISLALKSLGATIIDGDQLSRALTQPGGLALPAIRAEFGSEVFHADGTLDRRALGSLIFASDERRHALDDLMQPLLREMIEREILRAKEGGAKNLRAGHAAALRSWAGRAVQHGLVRVAPPRDAACPPDGTRRLHPRGSGKPPAQPNGHGGKRRAGRTSSSRQTARLKKPPR